MQWLPTAFAAPLYRLSVSVRCNSPDYVRDRNYVTAKAARRYSLGSASWPP